MLRAAAAGRAALALERAGAGARQRRLGDRRDGRRRRPAPSAGPRAGGAAALDLTEDPAILTAIANDVGVEAIFARQVIAHGRRGRRAAGDLHERRVGQRARRAGGGAAARAARRSRWSATTAGGSPPRASPTTSSSSAPSTSRASRRRRPRPHALRGLIEGRDAVAELAASASARAPGSRAWCRASASGRTCSGWPTELGLAGFVCNDALGVLVEVEGDGEAIAAFLGGCRAEAPPLAAVERVDRVGRAGAGASGFAIARQRARRRGRTRSSRPTPRPATPAWPSCSTPPTAATATRSSTAPTAARGSRSSAACPTTGR